MEFWIGLSVGMHLGTVVAGYLEKLIEAYGLLDASTVKEINRIQEAEQKVASVVDQLGK